MRVVLQRVRSASVTVHGQTKGQIQQGLPLLVGIETNDTLATFRWMLAKILRLRLFDGPTGFMEQNILDAGGSVLLVSQFTLLADTNKGTRPSFSGAAPSAQAKPLFEQLVNLFRESLPGKVECGVFGADMVVHLENDGPITLILDKGPL